jgi:hypothetical protein
VDCIPPLPLPLLLPFWLSSRRDLLLLLLPLPLPLSLPFWLSSRRDLLLLSPSALLWQEAKPVLPPAARPQFEFRCAL